VALSEGFQRYLGAVGGGGPSAPLAQGLVTGLSSYAEQQKKRREEEKAREREGLLFSLNQAIESGDEETIKSLGPKVYGGVDFGAVASAAGKNRAEKDRTAARARVTELLAVLPYADSATKEQLSKEIGKLQAQGLGLSETITRPTGRTIPSPTGETVPVPGRRAYGVGDIIPLAEAQGLAAAGLGASLMPSGAADTRKIKTAIPVVAAGTAPKMVEEMETVPRFSGFGEKKVALTAPDKRSTIRDMMNTANEQWKALSEAGRKAYRSQYNRYVQSLTSAQQQLLKGEDVELPAPMAFIGETGADVKERLSRDQFATKKAEGDRRLKIQERGLDVRRMNAVSQRISANASAVRGDAAAFAAETALKRFKSAEARRRFLESRDVKKVLVDIEKNAVRAAIKEAEDVYPASREKYSSDEDFKTFQDEREAWVKRRAAGIVEQNVGDWAQMQEPPAAATVTVVDKTKGGAKATVERRSANPVVKPQPEVGSFFKGRQGARQ